MIDYDKKIAIANSYVQMEHSLAFSDFRNWIAEECEAAERKASSLEPHERLMFEVCFQNWRVWKSVERAIDEHLQLAKEVIKESNYVGDPDTELSPAESSPYLPGYGV